MSGIRPGTCGDPGPGDLHCTDTPGHRYSCYDAGEDVSWNDNQFEMGFFDSPDGGPVHVCDEPKCPGRAETGGGGQHG